MLTQLGMKHTQRCMSINLLPAVPLPFTCSGGAYKETRLETLLPKVRNNVLLYMYFCIVPVFLTLEIKQISLKEEIINNMKASKSNISPL